ncbi:hypothetical protein AB0E70_04580 [Streptomyces murinus]|nr:hypothetical protein [Streptomyces murinus]
MPATRRADGALKSRLAAADRQIAQARGLDAKTGPWRRRRRGR